VAGKRNSSIPDKPDKSCFLVNDAFMARHFGNRFLPKMHE